LFFIKVVNLGKKDLIKRDGINILEKRENGDKKWQKMDKD